ncbi:MAG: FAD-binding oxidoreductase [Planctomycetaceae bacterium]|nr:FAD-binding oxidoreductase [Planctomycetaceae bacterium]
MTTDKDSITSSAEEVPPADACPTQKKRRWQFICLAIVVIGVLGRPAWHLISTAMKDKPSVNNTPPAGMINDASRLNETAVEKVVALPSDTASADSELAKLLSMARTKRWRVSIAGARHSMGGHTIYPGGVVLDILSYNSMRLDEEKDVLYVGSGALWSDIIPYLDQHGRSVAVMQSNNSFSVGGSLSVNCHGWQYGRPPIASTVISFRLLKADGTVVTCSRKENKELFSLVLGGYGLFGIILDVQLKVVRNRRYVLDSYLVPAEEALATYNEKVGSKSRAAMVYARMNVDPDRFLQDVFLNVLREDPLRDTEPPPSLTEPGLMGIRRAVFRGSVDSDYGKRLRWSAEAKLQPKLRPRKYSRNQLLNEGVEIFENRQGDSTDILHEYFVPEDRIALFIDRIRTIIPKHKGNLLNVTIRAVEEDMDTFLRYADAPMLSLVMLFNQKRTDAGEAAMEKMTREMIDASIKLGGRYYLPYRLHATKEQFEAAYPMAPEFFELKRKYDPTEMFQNQFYLKYGTPNVGTEAD